MWQYRSFCYNLFHIKSDLKLLCAFITSLARTQTQHTWVVRPGLLHTEERVSIGLDGWLGDQAGWAGWAGKPRAEISQRATKARTMGTKQEPSGASFTQGWQREWEVIQRVEVILGFLYWGWLVSGCRCVRSMGDELQAGRWATENYWRGREESGDSWQCFVI